MSDNSSDKITLTRRQAMGALGAGVIVAGGAAALTGAAAASQAAQAAEQQIQSLQMQLRALEKQNQITQRELAAAQLQIQMYQGLVGLYNTLDQIGIDVVVAGALSAFQGTLDALESGVNVLRAGIFAAENALDNFENAFAAVRRALTDAENAWANVNALFKNAQELIANATSPLLPFVDQARKFFDDLLGKIPFGAGEGARQALNSITGVLVAVPSALDALDDGLFKLLREGWFSDDSARNLEATLGRPIAQGVLAPARTFLDQVDAALKSWQAQVTKPVNAALSQRDIVRQQIIEYKNKNGLS